jgi:hypothetical protein
MDMKHIFIKSGGRVTAIYSVAHSTYKGVAEWYFLGDILFEENPDGSCKGALQREIPPYAVCYDGTNEATKVEAKEELDTIMAALNRYLAEKGKWLRKTKHLKDGRAVVWEPKEKNCLVPIEALLEPITA